MKMATASNTPFTSSFTAMKLKYIDYDSSIDSVSFIKPGDKINIFISIESVMHNLALIRGLDNKLLLERNFPTILESEFLNLCAHYRRFFRHYGIDTRTFLYGTDLGATKFNSYEETDEYRTYYSMKFLINPKIGLLGDSLKNTVIPRIKTICEFINDVHCIIAKDFEGSLIPYIIEKMEPERKSFIITADQYDTLYMGYSDKFLVHYIVPIQNVKSSDRAVYTLSRYLGMKVKSLVKEPKNEQDREDKINQTKFLSNPHIYAALLAMNGNKIRALNPVGHTWEATAYDLWDAAKKGIITPETNNGLVIQKAFEQCLRHDFLVNFNCMDLEYQYNQLREHQIFDVKNQIVNRFDLGALTQLNMDEYKNYPLMLPELTN